MTRGGWKGVWRGSEDLVNDSKVLHTEMRAEKGESLFCQMLSTAGSLYRYLQGLYLERERGGRRSSWGNVYDEKRGYMEKQNVLL